MDRRTTVLAAEDVVRPETFLSRTRSQISRSGASRDR
jgi:hypothetical protein